MKGQIFEEPKKYTGRLLPFMSGQELPTKSAAFFFIFSTMVGP